MQIAGSPVEGAEWERIINPISAAESCYFWDLAESAKIKMNSGRDK